eukprot:scaffold2195_cov430-Prasinococcus_capsulatus_cf.AAC.6
MIGVAGLRQAGASSGTPGCQSDRQGGAYLAGRHRGRRGQSGRWTCACACLVTANAERCAEKPRTRHSGRAATATHCSPWSMLAAPGE